VNRAFSLAGAPSIFGICSVVVCFMLADP